MARGKDIDIDDSVFQKRARALARKLGKDEKEFIKQQTGILAREVARMTPPFASFPKLSNSASVGSAKDIKAGKWAVYIDVAKICTVKTKGKITKAVKSWGVGPIVYGNKTIAKGIIAPTSMQSVDEFIWAMMAALLSAALWVNLATWIGAPVSTTHSIVAGVMGAGIAAAGFSAVNWITMSKIAASWVISPVLGGLIAALLLART